jgi:hypothetical protein
VDLDKSGWDRTFLELVHGWEHIKA